MKPTPLLTAALAGAGLALASPAPRSLAEESPVSWIKIQLSGEFYAEGACFGDLDGNGSMDFVSGPWIYHGPDWSAENRSAFYEPKPFNINGYSDNFFSFTEDFDGDGHLDILVIGFPGKEAWWHENPGPDWDRLTPWPRHLVLEVVDNESPHFADLTGDGQREIVCSQNGTLGYARPVADPRAPWEFIAISPEGATGARFTHGLGVGDVDGDGRADLLEKNAWWQQPDSLEGNPLWKRHLFSFSGPGGAQMLVHDFDGDGDSDIVTSLAAHAWGLAWFEQTEREGRKTLERHLIMGETPQENPWGVAFSQTHALALADIDGDGIADFVTGKRFWAHNGRDPGETDPAVLYWFQTRRTGDGGVEFVPWLIDDDSGVGTEVKVGDIDGDGLPDVLVGNKKGAFLFLQRRDGTGRSEPALRRPLRREFAAEGLDPGEAAERMTATEGFQVQVIAAEPELTQPIALAIDERGRLWVAEAHSYPIRRPEGEGLDRILLFEDRDGDGEYETRTVFAEGLNLVSGLEVGFGGVWVGAAPHLLFIPDRDGDGVPDGEPEILLDGWGYQDTHETLNSFTWGPDGWLWGCHGVFTHSRVGAPGTPDEEREPINAGVWRFHPQTRAFEVVAHGTSNPWGLDFDAKGEAFITACVIPHLYHVLPGGRYHRQAGQHFSPHTYADIQTIADHVHYAGNLRDHAHWGERSGGLEITPASTLELGGGHAHCGLVIYHGDQFPAEFRGKLLFNNLHGHGILGDFLVPKGSGHTGRHGPDFLHSNDLWHMGIDLKLGPDGSLFLLDWYDQQICHRREVELWDRSNGRLYQITYGDPVPALPRDLGAFSAVELAALAGGEDWAGRSARRLLQERAAAGEGGALDPAAEVLMAGLESGDGALGALWTLHRMGRADEALLLRTLSREDERLRAWAVRLAGESRDPTPALREKCVALAGSDQSPVVRRELASLLQRLDPGDRWELAAALLGRGEDAEDPNIPLLAWYGVEPLAEEDPARALELAETSRIPLVQRFLWRRLAHEEEGRESLLTRVGAPETPAERRAALLAELTAALEDRARVPLPAAWEAAFDALSEGDAETLRLAESLAVKFGDQRMLPRYRALVADPSAEPAARENALASLITVRDSETAPVLHGLAAGPASPFRLRAVRALAELAHEATAGVLLEAFASLDDAEQAAAVDVLAARPGPAKALLAAVGEGRVPRGAVSAFTARQIRGLGDEELAAALERHWGRVTESSEEKKAELERYRKLLTPDFLAGADLGHGRALYQQTCAACHALFGEGNPVGPDLTGGNRMDLEFLLENIIDPSAVLGDDYRLVVFTLRDDRVVSGMVRGETEDAVRVAMLGAEDQLLPKEEIVRREPLPVSMMPEGILSPLAPEQVRDLIAYLQSPVQVRLAEPGEIFLEGESLRVKRVAGNARPQAMGGFREGKWSGDSHLWWTGGRPGDELVLEFSVPEDGDWALAAALTKAHDYSIVSVFLGGEETPLAEGIDLYHADAVVHTGELSWGSRALQAGSHELRVKITGANPAATPSHMFGIDYLRLARR